MKASIPLPLKTINREASVSPEHAVFSLEEFKALVKYERNRSDRNGSSFSVIVFRTTTESKIPQKSLIGTISRFSRSIDCIGLVESGKIAVLLPDTVHDGAEVFGKKVETELLVHEATAVNFEIYTYPDNWLISETVLETNDPERLKSFVALKKYIESLFVDPIPVWKKFLDTVVASMMLVASAPIFIALGIFIKIVSPGPLFFKQTRIGYRGIPFTFWKVRTMKLDNDQSFHGTHAQSFILNGDIPMLKLDNNDPRIILGGKVIRKCCFDELPQLWNILRGEMSLVGPRPCIPYEAKEYLRWHTHRFDVLPGLSGLWQVSGKNKLTFKQMVRLDIQYCQNITLWGDLKIIFRTPIAIVKMVIEAFENKYAHTSGKGLAMGFGDTIKKAIQ